MHSLAGGGGAKTEATLHDATSAICGHCLGAAERFRTLSGWGHPLGDVAMLARLVVAPGAAG